MFGQLGGKLLAILEIANSVEAVQDGRIHIEKINGPFLFPERRAGRIQRRPDLAIARGWLVLHESGTPSASRTAPIRSLGFAFYRTSPIYPACANRHSILAFSTRRTVPGGKDWLHEIKHDGYRLIIQRDGKRVRLFTGNGHDWSDRFPLITEAALRNRNSSFVIDGEAVLLGVDGRSRFQRPALAQARRRGASSTPSISCERRRGSPQAAAQHAQGEPLRLLARRVDGIFLSDFEQGESARTCSATPA